VAYIEQIELRCFGLFAGLYVFRINIRKTALNDGRNFGIAFFIFEAKEGHRRSILLRLNF
jgi:hypothetical protein